jgi:type II secretory pathway pseudopilin PulG
MVVKRTNEKLWEDIKNKLLKESSNHWSARLAQQAVRLYKEQGGSYVGKKDDNNSLVKWTSQNWDYTGKEKQSRYLPKIIRNSIPDTLKRRENILKGNKLGENISYSKELIEIMKKKGIY